MYLVLFVLILGTLTYFILKYEASLPQISYIRNLGYTYHLQLEMLNCKTICVPVYSNSPTLQLSQLLSNPYSLKVSCFVFKSEVIYISTPETKYRIPEKQVLIKKLIPIKQSECSTIEEEM